MNIKKTHMVFISTFDPSFSYLDYSKSESDKRAYNKQSPSESSPHSDENEYRPENFMRRLSFDLSGDGLNKARRQTKKQENQSHRSPSGKQYCLVYITHALDFT